MQKIKSYIGFAIKSGSIIKGLDDIIKSRKEVYLLLILENLKENSKNKIQMYAKLNTIPMINVSEDLFNELNLTSVKILGVTDPNLANAIVKIAN